MNKRIYFVSMFILAALAISVYSINSIMSAKSSVSTGFVQIDKVQSSQVGNSALKIGEAQELKGFTVRSNEFISGGNMPIKYVCDEIDGGDNASIPLKWVNPPAGTRSFAVFMYDLSPVANNYVHWVVINIPNNVNEILEGASRTQYMPPSSVELKNSSGSIGYVGPCPPIGTGKHEYKIIVYALNVETLNLSGQLTFDQFKSIVSGKVIARAEMSGFFQR